MQQGDDDQGEDCSPLDIVACDGKGWDSPVDLTLGWDSDGIVARCGLILFGMVVYGFGALFGWQTKSIRKWMGLAIVWHVAIFVFVAFWVLPFYASQGAADAYGYHHNGMRFANEIRSGHYYELPLSLGTEVIPFIVALIYVPFGGDVYGMLFLCSSFSFLTAQVFIASFERARFGMVGRPYYAYLLFLPSICMWTSTLGKDCIVALGLALASHGVSMSFQRKRWNDSRTILFLVAGLTLIGVVRLHIALVVLLAAAAAALWPQTGPRSRSRLTVGLLLACIAGMLLPITKSFVGLEESTIAGAVARSSEVAGSNNIGGSTFGTRSGVAAIPLGLLYLIVRPFPWEARNINSALAACENILLCWLLVRGLLNAGQVWACIRKSRYLLFCTMMAGALLLLFSQLSNAGLISRQRVQLLPFLLACLVPTVASRSEQRRTASRSSLPRRGRPLPWNPPTEWGGARAMSVRKG